MATRESTVPLSAGRRRRMPFPPLGARQSSKILQFWFVLVQINSSFVYREQKPLLMNQDIYIATYPLVAIPIRQGNGQFVINYVG